MIKSGLLCFAAGSIAGVFAFRDDAQIALAEVLFVLFFLAGMLLIWFGDPARKRIAQPRIQHPRIRELFRRRA